MHYEKRVAARNQAPLWIAAGAWLVLFGHARAQTSEEPHRLHPVTEEPAASAPGDEANPMPESIGGMPDNPHGEYENYTSPLKPLGTAMFAGGYVVNVAVSLVYLATVYPLQALFGSSKVEPVMLWLLLPIAGPWMAQYEDHVKDSIAWRAVLIGDAAIQATGLVLGLIGLALSGTRDVPRESGARLELHMGVAGAGMTGLTLTLRTL